MPFHPSVCCSAVARAHTVLPPPWLDVHSAQGANCFLSPPLGGGGGVFWRSCCRFPSPPMRAQCPFPSLVQGAACVVSLWPLGGGGGLHM